MLCFSKYIFMGHQKVTSHEKLMLLQIRLNNRVFFYLYNNYDTITIVVSTNNIELYLWSANFVKFWYSAKFYSYFLHFAFLNIPLCKHIKTYRYVFLHYMYHFQEIFKYPKQFLTKKCLWKAVFIKFVKENNLGDQFLSYQNCSFQLVITVIKKNELLKRY